MFSEGGIRCNGANKGSSTGVLVSVITVVFNDVSHIDATIQSASSRI
jgi:hypothetical protein